MRLILTLLLILSGNCFAASFPTTPILDNANRSDENPLTNSRWSSPSYGSFANLKVSSNTIKQAVTAGSDGLMYWNTGNFGADEEVYVTISAISTTDNFVLLGARYTSTGNGYKIDWQAPSRIRVFRDDAGVRTQLGADITQTVVAGDSIGFSIIGSTITVWYKAAAGSWTSLGTRTDATYSAGGRLQLGQWLSADVASTIDDFGGGTVGDNGKMFQMF